MPKKRKREQLKIETSFTPPPRECGDCTLCCHGLVSAEALGYHFYPGQPCHFMGTNGCTVYKDRPPVCVNFKCAWLRDHQLPEWFRPDLTGFLSRWMDWGDAPDIKPYLHIISTKEAVEGKYFRWLEISNWNVAINSTIAPVYLGSDDFKNWMLENRYIPRGG